MVKIIKVLVLVQHYNTVLSHDTLRTPDCMTDDMYPILYVSSC